MGKCYLIIVSEADGDDTVTSLKHEGDVIEAVTYVFKNRAVKRIVEVDLWLNKIHDMKMEVGENFKLKLVRKEG